jgi:thiamine-monophosphate kinase
LGGGEDYELLFTVPIADHEKVAAMKDVRVVGHIVSDAMGLALITRDGVEMQLKAQGWTPQEQ